MILGCGDSPKFLLHAGMARFKVIVIEDGFDPSYKLEKKVVALI